MGHQGANLSSRVAFFRSGDPERVPICHAIMRWDDGDEDFQTRCSTGTYLVSHQCFEELETGHEDVSRYDIRSSTSRQPSSPRYLPGKSYHARRSIISHPRVIIGLSHAIRQIPSPKYPQHTHPIHAKYNRCPPPRSSFRNCPGETLVYVSGKPLCAAYDVDSLRCL